MYISKAGNLPVNTYNKRLRKTNKHTKNLSYRLGNTSFHVHLNAL